MEIKYTESFKRQLKRLARRYRHIKNDVKPLIDAVIAGETPGDQITGTDYILYKARAKNTDSQRGKSGGYRIIYYLETKKLRTFITLYSKSDQDDITSQDLHNIITKETKS